MKNYERLFNNKVEENKKLREKNKELLAEMKTYSDYFKPYIEFFDYIKTRVDKMVLQSDFPKEWEILQKGIRYWEGKIEGKEDGEIKAGVDDLIDYYEND